MAAIQLRIPTWNIAKRSALADTEGLKERFYELQSANIHPPRGGNGPRLEAAKRAFTIAQVEIWCIVQRLAVHEDPDLQWEIDMLRAKIVSQLQAHLSTGSFSMQPAHRVRALTWQDIELTPEISCDPQLTGHTALSRDVKQLRRLLRDQRALVLALVRSTRQTR